MSGLLLTQAERDRFASWLENEIESARLIIPQMEKMGEHMKPIIAREKMEASAALVILRKLRSIEDMSIG